MIDLDLVIYAGREETFDLGPVTRDDTNGDPQAVDLNVAGTKLWFTIRKKVGDAAAYVEKTWVFGGASDGIAITTGASTTVPNGTVTLDETDTDDVTETVRYPCELLLEEAGAKRSTIARGTIKIRPSISRPA